MKFKLPEMVSRRYRTSHDLKGIILDAVYDNRSIIVRLIAGLIFLSEGIQKYLFPELTGTARFEKIGFEDAEFWAFSTGLFEIVCGSFLIIGFLTRVAVIPLIVIMLTAFITTKLPILTDRGFWAMAHEYRTDFALTFLLLYLLIYGSGKWSIDSMLYKNYRNNRRIKGHFNKSF